MELTRFKEAQAKDYATAPMGSRMGAIAATGCGIYLRRSLVLG